MAFEKDDLGILVNRLERIEAVIADLVRQRTIKDWYTTGEAGTILGRSGYSVREWCRKGQAKAVKSANGRGWLISHDELSRLRNEGPLPEQEAQRVAHR